MQLSESISLHALLCISHFFPSESAAHFSVFSVGINILQFSIFISSHSFCAASHLLDEFIIHFFSGSDGSKFTHSWGTISSQFLSTSSHFSFPSNKAHFFLGFSRVNSPHFSVFISSQLLSVISQLSSFGLHILVERTGTNLLQDPLSKSLHSFGTHPSLESFTKHCLFSSSVTPSLQSSSVKSLRFLKFLLELGISVQGVLCI